MRYYKTIVVCAVICTLSVMKFSTEINVRHADKWAHGLMYSGLALVAATDLSRFFKQKVTASNALIIWISTLLYGAGMEAIQAALPYRSASWFDIMANSAGAAVGLAAFYIIHLTICRHAR